MSSCRKRPCWEIMQCKGGNCAAYKKPDKQCWEMARELNHIQSVHGVCADCIVYMSQQEVPIITASELDEILAHKKVYGVNYPKCPAIFSPELIRNREDRRLVGRFKTKDPLRAMIARQGESTSVYNIMDVSSRGLAFCYPAEDDQREDCIEVDICGAGLHLKSLPATVVSDRPLNNGASLKRRCGVKFADLSNLQQSLLEDMLQQHCQPVAV